MFDNSVDVVKFVEISDKGVNEVEGKYATTRLKFLLNFKEEFLEQLIKDDIKNNDYKSLKYHKIALERHKENIDTKINYKDIFQ